MIEVRIQASLDEEGSPTVGHSQIGNGSAPVNVNQCGVGVDGRAGIARLIDYGRGSS